MKVTQLLLTGLLLIFTGCTPIISEQTRKLVDTDASFQTLKENPERFIGKHIMLGGRIANVRNSAEGSQLEIVQFDLTPSAMPEDTFLSHGRFLATTDNFLDSLIYRNGMLITLVGEVKGRKTLRLDNMDYIYPLITMREWYLWSSADSYGSTYPSAAPQYNPYNYGYGVEPFLQRPYMPLSNPRNP